MGKNTFADEAGAAKAFPACSGGREVSLSLLSQLMAFQICPQLRRMGWAIN